jgi:hypothetical protein
MGIDHRVSHIISLTLRAFYWALVLLVALFVFANFLRTSGVGTHGPAKVERILAGTADRPYVYRVFLPLIANALAPALPDEFARHLGAATGTVIGERVFERNLNGATYPSQVVLILTMMYLSLVGFAITTWYALRQFGYSPRLQRLVPPLFLLGCLVFFEFGYIYDFSTLFFFWLALILMARRKWGWYVFILACGTLTKETMILLYPVFALHYWSRIPRRSFFVLSGLQLGIYGLLQGIIRLVFRDNPGSPFSWNLSQQLEAFQGLAANSPILLLYWSAALAIVATLVAYRWRNKPEFMRVALWVLPCLFALYMLGGYPKEIRVMLESYPVVAILMLPLPTTVQNGALMPGFPPVPGRRGSKMARCSRHN